MFCFFAPCSVLGDLGVLLSSWGYRSGLPSIGGIVKSVLVAPCLVNAVVCHTRVLSGLDWPKSFHKDFFFLASFQVVVSLGTSTIEGLDGDVDLHTKI